MKSKVNYIYKNQIKINIEFIEIKIRLNDLQDKYIL